MEKFIGWEMELNHQGKSQDRSPLHIYLPFFEETLLKVFDTKLVIQFLQVLQFCATIKHTYEPSIRPTLMLYCKFIVLPRAREVLNSVGIEYSFGKFSIKIDNDNEGKKDPMKTEEWLVEEKSVEKWSPKLETIEEEN